MNNNFLPKLIFMTDENRLKDPLPIIGSLPSGSAVILRHYGDPKRADLAKRLITKTRGKDIKILIAGDARLAIKVGAHGVHIPEYANQNYTLIWKNWRKPNWLVTAAAHSPKALLRAKKLGANAALLSPVFTSASHPNANTIGIHRFAYWCKKSPLAIYALGGITQANAKRLKGCEIQGIAGIGIFINNN